MPAAGMLRELATGDIVRRRGKLYAILRASKKRGKIHVYCELGVDFESDLEAFAHDVRYPLTYENSCNTGGDARDWIDSTTGHQARVDKRRAAARRMAEVFHKEAAP
jgi:hypothetical protein